MKQLIAIISAIIGFASLTAYSAPNSRSQKQLGEVERRESTTDVSRTREVIRREKIRENENIPTITKRQVGADINRMDKRDFMALGLPRDTAERVIQYRKEVGKFRSVEDLKRVPGMNIGWLNANREHLAAAG